MSRYRSFCFAVAVLLLVGFLAAAPASAGDRSRPPGYVDGSALIARAGEDALTVEISLHGALLRAITRADAELEKMAGGLESINAVIIDLENADSKEKVLQVVKEIQSDLRSKGWERLARIQEGSSLINVMLLNDDETIQGLVVLVVDQDEQQVIFANVAGVLDLAAIERLGEELDIPGLDEFGQR